MTGSRPTAEIDSPCTGICRLDVDHDWCVGCGRTLEEIARWGAAGDTERRRILAALPGRLALLEQADDAG